MYKIIKARRSDIGFIQQADTRAVTDDRRRLLVEEFLQSGGCYCAMVEADIVGYGLFDYRLMGHGFISELWVSPMGDKVGVTRFLVDNLVSMCRSSKIFTFVGEGDDLRSDLLTHFGFKKSGILYNLEEVPLLLLMRDSNN